MTQRKARATPKRAKAAAKLFECWGVVLYPDDTDVATFCDLASAETFLEFRREHYDGPGLRVVRLREVV